MDCDVQAKDGTCNVSSFDTDSLEKADAGRFSDGGLAVPDPGKAEAESLDEVGGEEIDEELACLSAEKADAG